MGEHGISFVSWLGQFGGVGDFLQCFIWHPAFDSAVISYKPDTVDVVYDGTILVFGVFGGLFT